MEKPPDAPLPCVPENKSPTNHPPTFCVPENKRACTWKPVVVDLKTTNRVPENKPLHGEAAPASHILRVGTLQYFLPLPITSHHTIVCLRNQGITVAVPSGLTPPYRRRYDLRHTSRTRRGLDRGASQSEASPLARGQRSWTFGPEAPGFRHGKVHKLTILPAFPGGLGASRSLRAREFPRVSHTPPSGIARGAEHRLG